MAGSHCRDGEKFCLSKNRCSQDCSQSTDQYDGIRSNTNHMITCPTGTVFCLRTGKCSKSCMHKQGTMKFYKSNV